MEISGNEGQMTARTVHLSEVRWKGWWEEIPVGDRLCAGEVYRTMRIANVSKDIPFFLNLNYFIAVQCVSWAWSRWHFSIAIAPLLALGCAGANMSQFSHMVIGNKRT